MNQMDDKEYEYPEQHSEDSSPIKNNSAKILLLLGESEEDNNNNNFGTSNNNFGKRKKTSKSEEKSNLKKVKKRKPDVKKKKKSKEKAKKVKKRKPYVENPAGGCNCNWDGCGINFTSVSELGTHVYDNHVTEQKKDNRRHKKSGATCMWDKCERVANFTSFYNLVHHIRFKHTGERPHICNVCPSRFCQKTDLSAHKTLLHGKGTNF